MSEHSTRVASSAVNSTEVDDVKKCWNSSIGLTSSFPCRETRPVGSGARRRTRGTGPYVDRTAGTGADRKSTRLNSSHVAISYAVFCLKKKTPAAHLNLSRKQAVVIPAAT